MARMASGGELAAHWDSAYGLGDNTRSWFQAEPTLSLRMLDAAGVTPPNSVVDVGGGASGLAAALVDAAFADVSVCDISLQGLQAAQLRLGASADAVRWIVADVLTWRPARIFDVWHDRAVFHFLTTKAARDQYRRTMQLATVPGSIAVFGCFAPDGPQRCSGLPVERYEPAALAAAVGEDWTLLSHEREDHLTPGSAVQPFTWAALRRDRWGSP